MPTLTRSLTGSDGLDRWARIQSQVWSRSVPDLLYDPEPAGDRGLRQAIADLVLPGRGLSGTSDDVVIVNSAQSAFDLIAATVPAGSAVVVEVPGYTFADGAFASLVYSGYAHFDADEFCGGIGELGRTKNAGSYGAARRNLRRGSGRD